MDQKRNHKGNEKIIRNIMKIQHTKTWEMQQKQYQEGNL